MEVMKIKKKNLEFTNLDVNYLFWNMLMRLIFHGIILKQMTPPFNVIYRYVKKLVILINYKISAMPWASSKLNIRWAEKTNWAFE